MIKFQKILNELKLNNFGIITEKDIFKIEIQKFVIWKIEIWKSLQIHSVPTIGQYSIKNLQFNQKFHLHENTCQLAEPLAPNAKSVPI